MKHYVGIDVGATRLKAGLVSAAQRITSQEVLWLEEDDKTEEGLLRRLAEVVGRVRGTTEINLVGLGVAGVVSRREGSVLRSPNFPAFDHFRLQQRLEPLIGEHVALDNDANCVVAGEFLQGQVAHALAKRGSRDMIGFTLGTGVGGAVVIGGSLWRGATGMAGELGHIVVDPSGPRCGCGSHGCLETFASVVGLRALCRAEPVEGVDVDSADLPRLLSEAARSGDATATRHFARAGVALGRVMGSLLNTLDVKTFLVAGGLTASWDLMEPSCTEEMRASSFREIGEDAEIVAASLGEKAGILGAAMQWMMAPHD